VDCWIDAPPHRQVVQARALLRADNGVDGAEISRYCTEFGYTAALVVSLLISRSIPGGVVVAKWRRKLSLAVRPRKCRSWHQKHPTWLEGRVMRARRHSAAAELLLLGL